VPFGRRPFGESCETKKQVLTMGLAKQARETVTKSAQQSYLQVIVKDRGTFEPTY